MTLKLNQLKRFEKQIILKKIGIYGQKKIKKAKVLVIGVGGLGCPLLSYLASSGISNIGIVDHDKVELGNLNRQILFDASDLGKYKVNQAKVKIKKIYSQIKIKTFKTQISKKNSEQISKYMNELNKIKNMAQPTKIKTSGSTFKNPINQSDKKVWELIRASVDNEISYGDAVISKKHANFFVNKKNAKSDDMKSLINFVKKKVKDHTGIKLELEIVVVE